jgi:hypothetical protein
LWPLHFFAFSSQQHSRCVAVALFCFLIAAALALLGTYRDVRQLNEHVADVLVRQLQMRLSRIEKRCGGSLPRPGFGY